MYWNRAVGLGLGLIAPMAMAANIAVVPSKLIVVDKLTAASKAKTVFVSKDKVGGITKGAGTDAAQISVQFYWTYDTGSTGGAFTLPFGASNGTDGWLVNKDTVAKYVNKDAPAGATETKVGVIKPGKLLKLVGKGLGDVPADILAAGDPGPGNVYTAYCVTNGGEENCHCSEFSRCAYKLIAAGSGAKLVCKSGTGDGACSAVATPTTTSTTTTTTSTTTTMPTGCCALSDVATVGDSPRAECFLQECQSECAESLLAFKEMCLFCDIPKNNCETQVCLDNFEGCVPGEICDLLYDEKVNAVCIQPGQEACVSAKLDTCSMTTSTTTTSTTTSTTTTTTMVSGCCALSDVATVGDSPRAECFLQECQSECAESLLAFKEMCLFCDIPKNNCETQVCLDNFEGCVPGEICDLLYDEKVNAECIQPGQEACVSAKLGTCP